jgi:hypothetical protein
MSQWKKRDQEPGSTTGKPNPDQAEGSRENVEATLGDQSKDGLDQSENSKGNVTVGRTPGTAEGPRKQINSTLKPGDGKGSGNKKKNK